MSWKVCSRRGHGPISDVFLAFAWRDRNTMWNLSWDSWYCSQDSSLAPPKHKTGVVLLETVCSVPKTSSVGTVSFKHVEAWRHMKHVCRYIGKISKSDCHFHHVGLSAWNDRTPTGWIFMKFDIDIGGFYENCWENLGLIKVWHE
jgi:hypothetical protein